MSQHQYFFIVIVLVACILGCESDDGRQSDETYPQQATSDSTRMADPVTADPVQKSKTAGESYFQAALDGQVQILESELLAGVAANAADPSGRTALMLAAFNGHTDSVELLITHGADINSKDQFSRTALMFAATGPNPETVSLLLKKGADVNAYDNDEGWTALMFAAAEGQTEIVRILLDKQADWTLKDIDGETACDFARNNRHPEIVKILDAVVGAKQD